MVKQLLLIAFLGLASTAKAESEPTAMLDYVHNEILLVDSAKVLGRLEQLSALLSGEQDSLSVLQQARPLFSELIISWKRVEAVYVAGALNSDYLDHPRYVDYFHQGNESIHELAERAIQGDRPMATELFKNSTRSINALEFFIYRGPSTDAELARQLEAARLAVTHIQSWLQEINDFYRTDERFVTEGKESLNKLVNSLIASSYRLKNWRVGEAGGFVKKYQGKPSGKRLEYTLSGLSLDAIRAILEVHRQIVKNSSGDDLFAFGKRRGVGTEMEFTLAKIDNALSAVSAMERPLAAQVEKDSFQRLYAALDALHNAYYFMLIDSLGLNSQIVDADGD